MGLLRPDKWCVEGWSFEPIEPLCATVSLVYCQLYEPHRRSPPRGGGFNEGSKAQLFNKIEGFEVIGLDNLLP